MAIDYGVDRIIDSLQEVDLIAAIAKENKKWWIFCLLFRITWSQCSNSFIYFDRTKIQNLGFRSMSNLFPQIEHAIETPEF